MFNQFMLRVIHEAQSMYNLQVICSLLNIQMAGIKDPAMRELD